MTFHSRGLEEDQPIVVRIRDAVGTDIDGRTTEMILNTYGQTEAQGEGYKILSLFSPNAYSYTFGVQNTSEKNLEVTLDLSSSDNMVFSSKGPIIKKNTKTGEMEPLMSIQAGFGNFNKVVRHSAKEASGK